MAAAAAADFRRMRSDIHRNLLSLGNFYDHATSPLCNEWCPGEVSATYAAAVSPPITAAERTPRPHAHGILLRARVSGSEADRVHCLPRGMPTQSPPQSFGKKNSQKARFISPPPRPVVVAGRRGCSLAGPGQAAHVRRECAARAVGMACRRHTTEPCDCGLQACQSACGATPASSTAGACPRCSTVCPAAAVFAAVGILARLAVGVPD